MEDYEIEERKQAAADCLFQYSRFAMACVGEGVRPADLRLHLMKEVSGMPSTLKRDTRRVVSDKAGEPSSSGAMRKDKTDNSHPMQQ